MIPLLLALAAEPPVVVVDRDNVEIRESCTVRPGPAAVFDADGNGVVHVLADGVTVDFGGGRLHGAAEGTDPDRFEGVGVRVTAGKVTIRNLRISGYRAGIYATGAADLVIEDCDVSDNFRQRLKSTPRAEDGGDWLWPHVNDANEWLARYGAGIYVEDSPRTTIRRVRARRGQNGIVLDSVNDGRIYDNDCSFLSGWGLALWRSSRNLISRNALDFCIRGYSHGVYNRGQDSAGILLFEQCSENLIVENSATHGGDGLFGFAGKEALGDVDPPAADAAWYVRRGNNDNRIVGNDFSYAAAHGLEMTFSSGNDIRRNRFAGNAICGIWAGYSRDTTIAGNTFERNGERGYGQERGGINIEHGRGNRIVGNRFAANRCGVFLWWDDDEHLLRLPGVQANGADSADNVIQLNRFVGDEVAIQLRRTKRTVLARNVFDEVGSELDADPESRESIMRTRDGKVPRPPLLPETPGAQRPVGARTPLAGREHIVMTEWGPYDWQSPLLVRIEESPQRHGYRVLGSEVVEPATLEAPASVALSRAEGSRLTVSTTSAGTALPYRLSVLTDSGPLHVEGVLLPIEWRLRVFPYRSDPREDPAAWRGEAERNGVETSIPRLDLRYGAGGPSDLDLAPAVRDAQLPADRFGTVATTRATLPAGAWRIITESDDGIRVWMNEELVIDDWTWHPPRRHQHEFRLEAPAMIELRVEHFELDGHAVLMLELQKR